jgi:hypothetical protein
MIAVYVVVFLLWIIGAVAGFHWAFEASSGNIEDVDGSGFTAPAIILMFTLFGPLTGAVTVIHLVCRFFSVAARAISARTKRRREAKQKLHQEMLANAPVRDGCYRELDPHRETWALLRGARTKVVEND